MYRINFKEFTGTVKVQNGLLAFASMFLAGAMASADASSAAQSEVQVWRLVKAVCVGVAQTPVNTESRGTVIELDKENSQATITAEDLQNLNKRIKTITVQPNKIESILAGSGDDITFVSRRNSAPSFFIIKKIKSRQLNAETFETTPPICAIDSNLVLSFDLEALYTAAPKKSPDTKKAKKKKFWKRAPKQIQRTN
jgi:Cu/Ag efflux protein CusF